MTKYNCNMDRVNQVTRKHGILCKTLRLSSAYFMIKSLYETNPLDSSISIFAFCCTQYKNINLDSFLFLVANV